MCSRFVVLSRSFTDILFISSARKLPFMWFFFLLLPWWCWWLFLFLLFILFVLTSGEYHFPMLDSFLMLSDSSDLFHTFISLACFFYHSPIRCVFASSFLGCVRYVVFVCAIAEKNERAIYSDTQQEVLVHIFVWFFFRFSRTLNEHVEIKWKKNQ